MLSVPKRANDAMHVSMLEGAGAGKAGPQVSICITEVHYTWMSINISFYESYTDYSIHPEYKLGSSTRFAINILSW